MKSVKAFIPIRSVTVTALVCLLLLNGCARYARDVNALYEPSSAVRGGNGEVYIHIPENQQTKSDTVRWVLGKVIDSDNIKIDEISSPRSPAELVQDALTEELRAAGYTALPADKLSATEKMVVEVTKAEIALEQVSVFTDLKVTCRVVMGLDVFNNGQLVKKVQYEAMSSRTDVKGRDLLARDALQGALHLVMQRAVPELHKLLQ